VKVETWSLREATSAVAAVSLAVFWASWAVRVALVLVSWATVDLSAAVAKAKLAMASMVS
jgi:hypothetical protein